MALDFPNSPTVGQFYPTTGSPQWQWDGTKWNAVVPSGGAVITVSDTAPATPSTGTLWFDSVGAQMYLWESDGNSTQWVPVVNQNGALSPAVANNVGRNVVHNGAFNIQQRGQGPWAVPANNYSFTADRWFAQCNGTTNTQTAQVTALSDANRASIGDESARYCLYTTVTGSAASGNSVQFGHDIEGVTRYSNKVMTLSFWAAAGTAGLRVGAFLQQYFGSGGTPSALVNTAGQNVLLATTPARYTMTFNVPSVAGKTLGTNGDDYLGVNLMLSASADLSAACGGIGVQSGVFWFWGVQLEVGSQATPFEHLDPQVDLANCQRFYQIVDCNGFGYGAAGSYAGWTVPFNVAMRGLPSATPSNISYGNGSGIIASISSRTSVLPYWTISATGLSQLGGNIILSAEI